MRINTIEELNQRAGAGVVRARLERLLAQIEGWSPERRASMLTRLARTFADTIDVQARRDAALSKMCDRVAPSYAARVKSHTGAFARFLGQWRSA